MTFEGNKRLEDCSSEALHNTFTPCHKKNVFKEIIVLLEMCSREQPDCQTSTGNVKLDIWAVAPYLVAE